MTTDGLSEVVAQATTSDNRTTGPDEALRQARRDEELRGKIADAITNHPGNRGGDYDRRYAVSLLLADAILPVVSAHVGAERDSATNKALRGAPTDETCADCTAYVPAPWFTDNATWNAVMNTDRLKVLILCPRCFIVRAEAVFSLPIWKLTLDQTAESGASLDSQLATAHYDLAAAQEALTAAQTENEALRQAPSLGSITAEYVIERNIVIAEKDRELTALRSLRDSEHQRLRAMHHWALVCDCGAAPCNVGVCLSCRNLDGRYSAYPCATIRVLDSAPSTEGTT